MADEIVMKYSNIQHITTTDTKSTLKGKYVNSVDKGTYEYQKREVKPINFKSVSIVHS